jgi:hypothetical protein
MAWRYDHTHFKCSDPEKTVAFFRQTTSAARPPR